MTASNPQSTSSAAVDGYTSGPNTPDLTTPVASTGAPSALSQAGTAYSAISGLTSGTTTGQIGGALSAGKLVNNNLNGANPQVGGALGAAGGVLGIYNGLQQGGVAGYGGAAVGALNAGSGIATMAANAGVAGAAGVAGDLSSAAGAIAIPLALYNFASNWQSGNTTSDAISGAETGATIGAGFGPEGTLIGAVGGAAIGAASSALGPGKTDPEEGTYASYLNAYTGGGTAAMDAETTAAGVQSIAPKIQALGGTNPAIASMLASNATKTYENTPAADAAYAAGGDKAVAGATGTQNFQALAGLFDARSSSLPMYQQYGRQGEGAFMTDMTTQINNAVKSGAISASATPQEIYSSVVAPWVGKMGTPSTGYQDPNTMAPVQELLTNLIGDYQQGQTMDTIGGTAANFGTYA